MLSCWAASVIFFVTVHQLYILYFDAQLICVLPLSSLFLKLISVPTTSSFVSFPTAEYHADADNFLSVCHHGENISLYWNFAPNSDVTSRPNEHDCGEEEDQDIEFRGPHPSNSDKHRDCSAPMFVHNYNFARRTSSLPTRWRL